MLFLLFLWKLIHFIFRLCWVLAAVPRLCLVAESRSYSCAQCVGSSQRGLLLLRSVGARQEALEVAAHGLSSWGSWARALRGMWDLLGPGVESMFSALADGFLTTGSPGKSSMWDLSTRTRNWTGAPEMEAQSSNRWTMREFPFLPHFFLLNSYIIYLGPLAFLLGEQARALSILFTLSKNWLLILSFLFFEKVYVISFLLLTLGFL